MSVLHRVPLFVSAAVCNIFLASSCCLCLLLSALYCILRHYPLLTFQREKEAWDWVYLELKSRYSPMYRTIHWNGSESVSSPRESHDPLLDSCNSHKSVSLLNLFRCYSSHLSVHSMCSCLAPASFWMHYTKNIHPLSDSTPVGPDTLHCLSSIPAVLFTFPLLLCAEEGKQAAEGPKPRIIQLFQLAKIKTHEITAEECWAVKKHINILIVVVL